MKRHIKVILLCVILLGLLLPAHLFATSNSSTKQPSRQVILILAPFITWDDITPQTTPAIWESAQETSIGDINARSRVKEEDGQPSLIEGALTISAGAWPQVDSTAFAAYNVTERFEFDTAGEAYGRFVGQPVGNNKIVYLGLPKTTQYNEKNAYTIIPGTLGAAIEGQGGTTIAIGNSDLGYAADAQKTIRPAAIVAMNTKGTVQLGDVSETILKRDPTSPYGARTDLVAIRAQMVAYKNDFKTGEPGLMVLDPGDGYRARQFASLVAPLVAKRQWNESLQTVDSMYALAKQLYPNATIVVASQASMSEKLKKEGFGPVIISGMKPGLLTSDSTQRPGLVTNLDLASTVYDILGIKTPVQVLGSPIRSSASVMDAATIDERILLLKRMNNTAIAVDKNRPMVVNTFVTMTVLILVFGAFMIVRADKHWRGSTVRIIKRGLYLLIIGVLSVPAASWLMFLIYRWPPSPTSVTLQLVAVALVLWGIAAWLSYRYGQRIPVIFLAAVTSVVIIVDQLLGAPASFTNFFGYSPIAAFRFYGIGNEGASVLFGAVVVGLAMALDQWPQSPITKVVKSWGLPLIGFAVMFVCAAPMLGANVGVAAWGTVGFVLLWMLFHDMKITWISIGAMIIAIVCIVGVFILIDRYGSGAETHLARAIGSAEQGGVSQLVEIVARKAETNLRVLTKTAWAYILIAVVAFLAIMRWRPSTDFAIVFKENKYFGDAMTAILVAGLVAYFTEDSGIVLPALMVLYLGCGIVWLMLTRVTGQVDSRQED